MSRSEIVRRSTAGGACSEAEPRKAPLSTVAWTRRSLVMSQTDRAPLPADRAHAGVRRAAAPEAISPVWELSGSPTAGFAERLGQEIVAVDIGVDETLVRGSSGMVAGRTG